MLLASDRHYVDRVSVASAISLLMMFSMLTSSVPADREAGHLDDEPLRKEQLGGGGSLEDQCGSITFENLFEYTHASFDIIVNEDWGSADV